MSASRTSGEHICNRNDFKHIQWLKYKFGGPGTLKKLGPNCKLRGPSKRDRTINGCVWPGNAGNFRGPGMAFRVLPLILATEAE